MSYLPTSTQTDFQSIWELAGQNHSSLEEAQQMPSSLQVGFCVVARLTFTSAFCNVFKGTWPVEAYPTVQMIAHDELTAGATMMGARYDLIHIGINFQQKTGNWPTNIDPTNSQYNPQKRSAPRSEKRNAGYYGAKAIQCPPQLPFPCKCRGVYLVHHFEQAVLATALDRWTSATWYSLSKLQRVLYWSECYSHDFRKLEFHAECHTKRNNYLQSGLQKQLYYHLQLPRYSTKLAAVWVRFKCSMRLSATGANWIQFEWS